MIRDYTRIQKEFDLSKHHLVHLLDTVATYQPTLLLSKNLNEPPLASYQPPRLREMMDALVPKPKQAKTSKERLKDQKRFLSYTNDENVTHPILTKTIPVAVLDTSGATPKEYERRLTFTFNALVNNLM